MFRSKLLYKVAALALAMSVVPALHAQTYNVIHTFSGNGDGYQPYAGLTQDSSGRLYGTTSEYVSGTVFQMKRVNGSWILSTLYNFSTMNGNDGLIPYSEVVFGAHGTLYGTTLEGGTSANCEFGCGAVYNLKPPSTVCKTVICFWNSIPIHSFTDGPDGGNPNSTPVFDSQNNLYGTAALGGTAGIGVAYEMTESSGGTWTQTVIHNFTGADGAYPYATLVFDLAGNLYGTTGYGGQFNQGTIFRLSPSGSGWNLTTLYSFHGSTDGAQPNGGVILDSAGNLYGATAEGGSDGGGTVYELSPSRGSWNFSLLYSLAGRSDGTYYPGPVNALAMDGRGNLYGTALLDGAFNHGSAFELTPSNGSWTYTSLHDFTGGTDGSDPIGSVLLDGTGNIYGTAAFGGAENNNCFGGPGCGVVWEITP